MTFDGDIGGEGARFFLLGESTGELGGEGSGLTGESCITICSLAAAEFLGWSGARISRIAWLLPNTGVGGRGGGVLVPKVLGGQHFHGSPIEILGGNDSIRS